MKNPSNKLSILFVFILAGCFMQSCNNHSLVEEKFTVEDGQWNMNEIFTCKFPVTDTLGQYNFYLNVRNSGDYPYSNLYVFANTYFPNGKVLHDTIFCELADKNGKWKGSGLGDVLDNRILYHAVQRFPVSGEYKITLQHGMRDTIVPAILNVGISIEKEH